MNRKSLVKSLGILGERKASFHGREEGETGRKTGEDQGAEDKCDNLSFSILREMTPDKNRHRLKGFLPNPLECSCEYAKRKL